MAHNLLELLLALSYCSVCLCALYDLYGQTRYHETAITIRHIRLGSVTHAGFGLSYLRMSQLAFPTSSKVNIDLVLSSLFVYKCFSSDFNQIFPSCFTQHILRQTILPSPVILQRDFIQLSVLWTHYAYRTSSFSILL
jgi:hypothetical protein